MKADVGGKSLAGAPESPGERPVAVSQSRTFIVVLRGPSAAVVPEEVDLLVNESHLVVGTLEVHIRTRWLNVSQGAKMPGHIWVEVRGSAESIDQAINVFSRTAMAYLPVVSLAANASINDIELEVAFETTSGVTERDFFQNHLPEERGLPRQARRVDPGLTVKLLDAIHRSAERERVMRAANQYRLALQSWRVGYESMVVAHLWMAVEALTKAMVRTEIQRRGFSSEAELAAKLGVDLRKLDATVRRDVILAGNNECYENGKAASDELEHGYLGFDEIRAKSAAVRDTMADLVRAAIFGLVGLDSGNAAAMLAEPYTKPLGNWPLARYLRGKLLGPGDRLAAEGNAYPVVSWSVSAKSATLSQGGSAQMQFSESMTPQLAPGISLKPMRHEVWGN